MGRQLTQGRGDSGNGRDKEIVGFITLVSDDRADGLDYDDKVDGKHPFRRQEGEPGYTTNIRTRNLGTIKQVRGKRSGDPYHNRYFQ